MNELDDLRFEIIRGAMYHDDLERHYARLHRWIMFIVIFSGTAAAANMLPAQPILWWPWAEPSKPVLALLLSLLSTLAGTVDIVWDVSGKARLHSSLKRQAYDLLADCEDADCDARQMRQRIVRTLVDEPPILHAANALAFNGAAQNMDYRRRSRITPSQRFWRHWRAYDPTDFPEYSLPARTE
ncbi:MAG: hypothetical protein JWM36_3206 [Hyphomicrobiales bacterium]|nr:hypothetical protein [Hyphomicrobiales bacterium]